MSHDTTSATTFATTSASTFQAGLAAVSITPPAGSHLAGFFTPRIAKRVRDPLYAKVFAFRRGPKTALVIICDLIALPRDLADRLKTRIAAATGLLPGGMMIACNHNHCGPATLPLFGMEADQPFCDLLLERVTEGAILALERLEPVRVGAAWAEEPSIVFNRRYLMRGGHYATNPGYLNPDIVRPAYPADPSLAMLVLATPAGEPRGILASLNSHYIGGDMWDISADTYGIFARQVTQKLGQLGKPGTGSKSLFRDFEPVPGLPVPGLSQCQVALAFGCGGDVNNIDVTRPEPPDMETWGHAESEMDKLSDRAVAALDAVQWFDDPALDWRLDEIDLPNRVPAPAELDRARALVAAGGAELKDGLDMSDSESDAARRALDLFFARELLRLAGQPPPTRTLAQSIRVGGLAIAAFPGEFFCEYARRLREQAPAPHTLPLGLANDCCGYIPTPPAFGQPGTYETRLSGVSCKIPEAGDRYMDVLLGQIRDLFGIMQ